MDDRLDDDFEECAESQPNDSGTCPVCGGAALVKPLSRASSWVSCTVCGDYDITPDCRETLCGDQDVPLEETGIACCASASTVGTLRSKLRRYLAETRETGERIVLGKPSSSLPQGTTVPIALSDVARMYEPTSDFEADYRAALEAFGTTEAASGSHALSEQEACALFPFADHFHCQKLFSEMKRRGAIVGSNGDMLWYRQPHEAVQEEKATPVAEPSDAPAPVAPARPLPECRYLFREGVDVWEIVFDGQPVSPPLRNCKGLKYIAFLLAHPGVEFYALQLVHEVDGTAYEPDPIYSGMTTEQLGEEGLSIEDHTSSAQILDSEYEQACRENLTKAIAVKQLATARGDGAGVKVANEYIKHYRRALSEGRGLSGRRRMAATPVEKARSAVTKTVKRVLAKVRAEHSSLYDHLSASLITGTVCSYSPTNRAPWEF